jgi:hypothetical protein
VKGRKKAAEPGQRVGRLGGAKPAVFEGLVTKHFLAQFASLLGF